MPRHGITYSSQSGTSNADKKTINDDWNPAANIEGGHVPTSTLSPLDSQFGWNIDVLTPHPKQGLYSVDPFADKSIEAMSGVNLIHTTNPMPRWQNPSEARSLCG